MITDGSAAYPTPSLMMISGPDSANSPEFGARIDRPGHVGEFEIELPCRPVESCRDVGVEAAVVADAEERDLLPVVLAAEHAEQEERRDAERDAECGDRAPQPSPGPGLVAFALLGFGALSLEPPAAGGEELELLVVQGHRRRLGPAVELGDARRGQQVVGVFIGEGPLVERGGQRCMASKVVAALVDPALQRRPRRQQRLVGDLDGRRPGEVIGVERQQAVLAEPFDHRLHRHRVDRQRGHFAGGYPAPAALVAVADHHEPQEELTGGVLLLVVELVEQIGCPSLQRAVEAAHRPVRRGGQHVAGAAVEQLGQGVLEQRERPRLAADIGDQLARAGPARTSRPAPRRGAALLLPALPPSAA